MITEVDKATREELRNWWVQPLPRLIREDSEDLILDEIAYSLSKKDPDWIDFLMQYAYSEDLARRGSVIYFLAGKTSRAPKIESVLRDAFFSRIPRLQATALQGCIHTCLFPLTKDDIASLDGLTDERLSAWGMTYLCYAFPEERIALLKHSLRSENPRIREFACDVIGDELIQELKNDMEPLLKDPEPRVAESARYNYFDMLD